MTTRVMTLLLCAGGLVFAVPGGASTPRVAQPDRVATGTTADAATPPVAAAAATTTTAPGTIDRVTGVSFDGPASDPTFSNPLLGATASDEVLLTDPGSSRVIRVHDGQTSVVAGSGLFGSFGDGSPAVKVHLNVPGYVARASDGSVYIAETGNHAIRRVGPDGIMSTIAGGHGAGFSGDVGPAVAAQLSGPTGIAIGPDGTVYVADTGNNRVRSISLDGTIRTVAGTGAAAVGPENVAGSAATFSAPGKLAVDVQGRIYVDDHGNHRVRRISALVETIAGGGVTPPAAGVGALAAGFTDDMAIAVDGGGHVTVRSVRTVYEVANGALRVVPAPSAAPDFPQAPAGVQAEQCVYGDVSIRPDGTLLLVYGLTAFIDLGNSSALIPRAVAQRNSDGTLVVIAGRPLRMGEDPTPALQAALEGAHSLAASHGTVYSMEGGPQFMGSPSGDHLISSSGGTTSLGRFGRQILNDIAIDPFGDRYIARVDLLVGPLARISKSSPSGGIELDLPQFPTIADCTRYLGWPEHLAVSRAGVFIVDTSNHCIKRYISAGVYEKLADTSSFGSVDDIAAGDDGSVYVADRVGHRVWRVRPDRSIDPMAGTGALGSSGDGGRAVDAELATPQGLAMDRHGNLYIADSLAARIRKVALSGVIETVAFNGAYGYRGDGGPAGEAWAQNPTAVAVDESDNIYVLDTDVIRRIAAYSPLPNAASRFVATSPRRVLDTRDGTGGTVGPIAPAGTVVLPLAGPGAALPAKATAVVLNVTATATRGPGYVQIFPTGGATVGSSSNVNVGGVGQTVPNLAFSPLGTDGSVSIYTQGGGELVADLVGYFLPADIEPTSGRYVALAPTRVLDTRTGQGVATAHLLSAGEQVVLDTKGLAGIPARGVSSVVLNVTATEASGPGYVQVIPTGGSTPIGASSNLNLMSAGQTVANLVVVSIGPDGGIVLYAHGAVHLVADVLGYFTSTEAGASTSGVFVPVAPARLYDTREHGAVLAPQGSVIVHPADVGTIPAVGVAAVVANLTATDTVGPGFVQAAPTGRAEPGSSSNLNVERSGQTIANAAVLALGDGGSVTEYTQSGAHLVTDVAGWFSG